MDETINYKVKAVSPFRASEYNGKNLPKANRYKWISLDLTEPNLGVPIPERESGVLEDIETLTNYYGLSTLIYPPSYVENNSSIDISVYEDLKIDIHLDMSSVNIQFLVDPSLYGTINTLATLMSGNSPLKQLLLPLYGGNESIMLDNVRVIATNYTTSQLENDFGIPGPYNEPGGVYAINLGGAERTLNWAYRSLTDLHPSERKIVFIFCDESSPSYYGDTTRESIFDANSALKPAYTTDYFDLTGALESRRLAGNPTSSIFHISVGKSIYSTYWADAYFQFLEAVKTGAGSFSAQNFSGYDEFNVDAMARGATLGYYSNVIMQKLKSIGYSYNGSTLLEKYYVASDLIGERSFDGSPTIDSAQFTSEERPDLPNIDSAINELLYVFPEITTFTVNNSSSTYYIEPAQSIPDALLRWETNKESEGAIVRYRLTFPDNTTINLDPIVRYRFRNIIFSVSGSDYINNPPSISTETLDPLSTFEPAVLRPIMNGTDFIGISVVDPGEYATYDINVIIDNTGNPSPVSPEIKTIGLNRTVPAPRQSYDIGSLVPSTEMGIISTYKLEAIDWAGNRAYKELKIQTTGYIYYGASTIQDIEAGNIIGGINVGGGLRRLEGRTARFYNINCTGGLYYYIAYPSYINNPSTTVQGFPVTNVVKTNISMPVEGRPDLPDYSYNAVISNNRQRGSSIPINVS